MTNDRPFVILAEAARQRVINIVNNFFHSRQVAIPPSRSTWSRWWVIR